MYLDGSAGGSQGCHGMARPYGVPAFNQILTDTAWSELDFLIVDMPPGTGDIQLSLAGSVEVTGAVIVTTPQDVALADARKGIEMFQKVGVPILGIVENMAMHVCSQCGHSEAIFVLKEAVAWWNSRRSHWKTSLDIHREKTDSGDPVVASEQARQLGPMQSLLKTWVLLQRTSPHFGQKRRKFRSATDRT